MGWCWGSRNRNSDAGALTATPCQQMPPRQISGALSLERACAAGLRDKSHVSALINAAPTSAVDAASTNNPVKLRPATNAYALIPAIAQRYIVIRFRTSASEIAIDRPLPGYKPTTSGFAAVKLKRANDDVANRKTKVCEL